MSRNLKKAFLNKIGVRKKKTPIEVFTQYKALAVAEIKKLPKGSTQAAEFVQRLKDANAKAKLDTSPKVELKALLLDIKAAQKGVDDVSEMAISSPSMSDEDVVRAAQELGKGVAAVEAAKYRTSLTAELDKVDEAVNRLHVAVRQRDIELGDYSNPYIEQAKKLRIQMIQNAKEDANTPAADLDAALSGGTIGEIEFNSRLDALKSGLVAKLTTQTAEYSTLIGKIEDTIVDADALSGMAVGAREDQDRKSKLKLYRAKISETEKTLRQIEDWGVPEAPRLRKELKASSPANPADINSAMDTLDELQVAIKGYGDVAAKGYDIDADKYRARLKVVDGKMSRLLIAMQLNVNSNWEKAHNKQVTLEVKIIENMIDNGKSKKALAAASELIDSLDARALDLETNLAQVIEVSEVDYQCRLRIQDKTHTKTHPELCAALDKRLQALVTASRSMAASVAVDKFNAFKAEIWGTPGSLEEVSKLRKNWKAVFKLEAKAVEGRLSEMFKAMKSELDKKAQGQFEGKLAADLKTAKKLSKNEDQPSMDEAMRLLAVIKSEANQAKAAFAKDATARDENETALCNGTVENQEAGVAAAAQLVEDKATFARDYQQFKDFYERLKQGKANGPEFSGELKASWEMGRNARDLMKSTKDFPRCDKILKAARTRLTKLRRLVNKTPKDLAQINSQWNRALRQMGKQVDSLQDAAVTMAQDVGDDARETAAGTIASVINSAAAKYLVVDAFKQTGKDYANPDLTHAQTLRLREATLKKITLMKEFLSNDPTLRAAQANPFNIKNVVSPVFMALRDIEYKVLVTT